ncbi:MAG: translation elongation factor Ts [Myxococcota bacterium]
MAEITASAVKMLRDQTGAGMMDCKRALADADGDGGKAIELLRERGLAKAGKRSGRATSEGIIGMALGGSFAAVIELGSETDFVAKTDEFQAAAAEIAEAVASTPGVSSVAEALAAKLGDGSIEDRVGAVASKVGENIVLKRVGRLEVASGITGGYIHAGGKLGVIVAIGNAGTGADALAKDIAMHVAATDPTPIAVDRDGVDVALVEKERELLGRQAAQTGKPENVIARIVEGRMGKFFQEFCLVEQPFVKDPDRAVGDLLTEGASIEGFVRFKVGEASSEDE